MTQSRNQTRPPQAGQTHAPMRGELATIVGSDANPQRLTEKLTRAAELYNVVAPQTAVGTLPEGCDVAIVAVVVDPETESYAITGGGGTRGLSKVALDKIDAAAGISWDANLSGRLDDGRHPHYCHFRKVGHIRNFDGSVRTIANEKVMDLRDGSAQVDEILSKAKTPDAGWAQVRQTRVHILSHAETKARLRAVRSIGLRSSYSPDALRKPFVIAKLVWTGKTQDPELRRAFALKQQDAMLGANAALYGAPSAPATITHRGYAPPPVDQTPLDDDGFDTIDVDPEPPRQPAPQASRQQAKPNQPAAVPPQAAQQGEAERHISGFTIPGGTSRGMPIEDAEDRDLNYWMNRKADELANDTDGKFADRNRAWLAAAESEMARRRGEVVADAGEENKF